MNEILITENHAENSCPKECEQDHDVIVVRTLKTDTHASVRGSILQPSSPIYNASKAGDKAVPIQIARFGKDIVEEYKESLISRKGQSKASIAVKAVASNKQLNPQNARAKTFTAPKDFREELRKLNQLKQKMVKQRVLLDKTVDDFVDISESKEYEQPRDYVTVSTLGLNEKDETAQEETAEETMPNSQQNQPKGKIQNDVISLQESLQLFEEKESKRTQRKAEMENLLNQLAGKLSKSQKIRKAHSSDITMVKDR